jgi:two-component system, chemotaxis family, sensor kinase Cph1
MQSDLNDNPAFGEADLSNCEREQIHLPGSIQPHGAVLVMQGDQLQIVQASANLRAITGVDDDALGRPLADYDKGLADTVSAILTEERLDDMPQSLRGGMAGSPHLFDVAVHRAAGKEVIAELERAHPGEDLTAFIDRAFQSILSTLTLRELCDETARVFKELTRYDRVMVYRFDQEGHGEVFSEERERELEAYLGNRYPASDIPQIARRLYERNRIRVLVDVGYEPVPLERHASVPGCPPLDMSLCSLRSVSPIHLQYLKNMGVTGTLVVSLMVGGALWGLVSCHHYRARNISYETKAACEMLAEVVATRISALESFARAEAELSVRRLQTRFIEAIAREGDWRRALFDNQQVLLQPLQASGAALAFEGQIMSTGEVPGTQQVRAIVDWLEANHRRQFHATTSLASEDAEFASMSGVASGMVSVPVSRSPGEYLIWFRPERIRTVTWGGNPFKPVEVGNDPRELSPRRSFSQWHQLVEGTSDPWSIADLTAARLIGESIEDVVYQSRAVRMLIAQDQLAQVKGQVRGAQQPVIVADASGRLLLVNDAFYKLTQPGSGRLHALEDLPGLFADRGSIRELLEVVLRDQQTWRGEVVIAPCSGDNRVLTLRADPVFAGAGRLLGFVLFFSDITHRKMIDVARRGFQEGIVTDHRHNEPELDSHTALLFRNLLGNVLSNAKLAALEISDTMEIDAVPTMLESVRESVSRTRTLLRHLLARQVQK